MIDGVILYKGETRLVNCTITSSATNAEFTYSINIDNNTCTEKTSLLGIIDKDRYESTL